MANHSTLDNASDKLFESTLQKVSDQLAIRRKDIKVGLKLTAKFDELKKYERLFVHKTTELVGDQGSFIILLIEKHSTIVVQKKNGRVLKEVEEVEPILIFSVPHDMGQVFISEETIADKINDLFSKVDIDFEEYPDFSRKYYVVGEKPSLVKEYLPKQLIQSIGKVKGLTIEINGNWGLVRTEKNLTEQLLLLMLSLGYKMTK